MSYQSGEQVEGAGKKEQRYIQKVESTFQMNVNNNFASFKLRK
jgi:hypothetical protein